MPNYQVQNCLHTSTIWTAVAVAGWRNLSPQLFLCFFNLVHFVLQTYFCFDIRDEDLNSKKSRLNVDQLRRQFSLLRWVLSRPMWIWCNLCHPHFTSTKSQWNFLSLDLNYGTGGEKKPQGIQRHLKCLHVQPDNLHQWTLLLYRGGSWRVKPGWCYEERV